MKSIAELEAIRKKTFDEISLRSNKDGVELLLEWLLVVLLQEQDL